MPIALMRARACSICLGVSASVSVAALHPAGIEGDPGADVAGHHDRAFDVRRVQPEVGLQRLGEALHRELGRG